MNIFSRLCSSLRAASAALVALVALLPTATAAAQSNPAPQPLPYTQTFGTTNFNAPPAGWAVWNGLSGASTTTQATAAASAPTSDGAVIGSAPSTAGGIYGDGNSGNARLAVVTSSNATNGVNQPVLAINTSGFTAITLSYKLTNVTANTRTVGAVAQYRLGTAGAWTTLPSVTGNPYIQSGGSPGTNTNVSISLPPAAENQAVVQIRWAVWRGTEAGNSSAFAIDDLSITGNSGGGPSAPAITSQPSSQTVTSPAPVSFTVGASGSPPLSFQWRKGGVNLSNGGTISGANTQTLTISSTVPTDNGGYDCVVTNSQGSATSNEAALIVNPPATGGSQFDPPPNYYNAATGSGPTLKAQLASIISAGYVTQSYDDARFSLQTLDQDPANPNNVLLMYTGASVPKVWDAGVTWNREHCWPQARGTSASPQIGDLHHLRACNPAVNSSRSDKNFGLASGQWDPAQSASNNNARGQAARAAMYMDTRFDASLSLVDGDPASGSGQLGSRAQLLSWHFAEPPNTFERRRNHLIYTSYQLNRNPFIDNPNFAWSIYGPSGNDATLYLGSTRPPSGASALTIDLGRFIVGSTITPASVTLNKAGANPTYFSVSTSGAATSSITGIYNAFTENAQARSITAGLTTPAGSIGQAVGGSIVIDNTERSSSATGSGSQDANDTVTLAATMLSHANASFSPSADSNTLSLNFSPAAQGSASITLPFNIHNLAGTPGFTAGLIVTAVTPAGSTSTLSIDTAPFASPAIEVGAPRPFLATFDPAAAPGNYSATFTIAVADEAIPGAAPNTSLVLTLNASIEPAGPVACNPADIAGTDGTPGPSGNVDNGDFQLFFSAFFSAECSATCGVLPATPCNPADIAATDGSAGPDGCVDNGDFSLFFSSFFSGC